MKLTTGWLILWFSIGGVAPIGRVTAQRKHRPKGGDYSAPGSGLSGPMSPRTSPDSLAGLAAAPGLTRSDPPILQSAGKRSPEDWKLVSLSEELDPLVAVVGTQELVAAVGKTAKPGPNQVVPPANATQPKGDSFRSYMETHHKKYYAQYRAQRRRSAYMDNLDEITEHNKEFEAGKNRFRLAPNAFADMQNSEYRKRLIRLKMDPHRKVSPTIADEIVSSVGELPESLDWREQGFKTAQANQKSCGSCYAFSVAYAVSAQLMKHIGRVELVSEQQLVDCSSAAGNLGCGGGSLRNTLKYLKEAGGVMRASDYPYTSSVESEDWALVFSLCRSAMPCKLVCVAAAALRNRTTTTKSSTLLLIWTCHHFVAAARNTIPLPEPLPEETIGTGTDATASG